MGLSSQLEEQAQIVGSAARTRRSAFGTLPNPIEMLAQLVSQSTPSQIGRTVIKGKAKRVGGKKVKRTIRGEAPGSGAIKKSIKGGGSEKSDDKIWDYITDHRHGHNTDHQKKFIRWMDEQNKKKDGTIKKWRTESKDHLLQKFDEWWNEDTQIKTPKKPKTPKSPKESKKPMDPEEEKAEHPAPAPSAPAPGAVLSPANAKNRLKLNATTFDQIKNTKPKLEYKRILKDFFNELSIPDYGKLPGDFVKAINDLGIHSGSSDKKIEKLRSTLSSFKQTLSKREEPKEVFVKYKTKVAKPSKSKSAASVKRSEDKKTKTVKARPKTTKPKTTIRKAPPKKLPKSTAKKTKRTRKAQRLSSVAKTKGKGINSSEEAIRGEAPGSGAIKVLI